MTVSLLHRMQEPINSKTKQNASKDKRSKRQTSATAFRSTSTSCLPADQRPPSGSEEDQQSTDAAATTQTTIQNASMDERTTDSAEETKQECLVLDTALSASAGESDPASRVSRVSTGISATKDSQSDTETSVPPSGVRTPPPSMVSATSSYQTTQPGDTSKIQSYKSDKLDTSVLADKVCVHLSDNVPVPSKTDAIARVSREVLDQNTCSLKDDEDSDVFASGEEWEEDKKSEYSTADEDCECQYKKRVQKMEKELGIDEDSSTEDGNSLDTDPTDSARTDAKVRRDPCGPTFAILGANSEALRPVLVRQVSQDEDVRVTSDDDDNDRLGQIFDRIQNVDETQDDMDDPIVPMQHIYCECTRPSASQLHASHDMATSPIQGKTARQAPSEKEKCDDATEPIRWSELQSMRSVVTVQGEKTSVRSMESKSPGMAIKEPSEERAVTESNSRWRSTLPIIEPYGNTRAVCVSSSSREIRQPMYPTTYPTMYPTAARYSAPIPIVHLKSTQQQMKERRVRQTMVEALAVCEEELGPLAVTLAQLQEKVRSLNLPEMNALRRPIATPICGQSNNYLAPDPSTSISRGNQRMGVPTIASGPPCPPPSQQYARSQSDAMAPLAHDIDCFCRYCGLQVGADANLSPVARMYILLAQPHRKSCEEESESQQHDERRM